MGDLSHQTTFCSRWRSAYICVHICICVTSKNISLTEDAYELLKKMKMGDESFSDTIRRLARRRRLSDCAGLWGDVPDEEMEALSESLLELRRRTGESLEAGAIEGS